MTDITITDDMRRIIEDAGLSYVATVSPDGWPNLSPKGSVKVYDDTHIAFMDIASPNTIRNLKADPRIEINTIDVFRRRGYRFRGEAAILPVGDPVYEWLNDWLLELNGPGYPANQAVLVNVTRILPILSPAYGWGHAKEEDLVTTYFGRYRHIIERAGREEVSHDARA